MTGPLQPCGRSSPEAVWKQTSNYFKTPEMLVQLPKMNNSSDMKQQRQLLDKTEAAIRSLQGIGVSSETYGTFLTPVIIPKIPQELRLILSRGMTNRT